LYSALWSSTIDPDIRFVGIYHKGELYSKLKEGTKSYLADDEAKRSLSKSIQHWEDRKELTPKIGRPYYSITMYEMVKIFTVEVVEGMILLLSADVECDYENIILGLTNLKPKIKEILVNS